MSAELALMNQVLNKALKNNIDADKATVKVPVTAGDMDIAEGAGIQLSADGKAYPVGQQNVGGGFELTRIDDSLTYGYASSCSSKTTITPDLYAEIDTVNVRLNLFKFNNTTKVYENVDSIVRADLGFAVDIEFNTYTSISYSIADGYILLFGSSDYTNDKCAVTVVGVDTENGAFGAILKVVDNVVVANNASRYSISAAVLNNNRLAVTLRDANNNDYYSIYELESDLSGIASSDTSNDLTIEARYIYSILDTTNSALSHSCYVGTSGNIVKITLTGDTGCTTSIETITSDENTPLWLFISTFRFIGNSANSGQKKLNIMYNNIENYGITVSTTTSSNSNGDYSYAYEYCYKPLVYTFDDDDVITVETYEYAEDVLYGLYPMQINTSAYNTTISENTIYTVYNNNAIVDGYMYKGHEVIGIERNIVNKTIDVKLVAKDSITDITDYVYTVSTISEVGSDGTYRFNAKLKNADSDRVLEIGTIAGSIVYYTPVELRATAAIAANTSGIALTDKLAFEELGKNPGDLYLNEYKITDTNYAVKLKGV